MNFNFLLPKQPAFFNLFGKQSQEIHEIAKLFDELSRENNQTMLATYAPLAKETEHRADKVIQEIIRLLNASFITPFDREDIHALAGELDDIVDKVENVIHNIVIYKINPQHKFIAEFAKIILQDAQYLNQLISFLEKQKYTPQVRDLIVKIHNLEDDGDELFLKALSDLFSNGADPVTIIKLKDIAEDLEEVMDCFQTASISIENIFVKTQ